MVSDRGVLRVFIRVIRVCSCWFQHWTDHGLARVRRDQPSELYRAADYLRTTTSRAPAGTGTRASAPPGQRTQTSVGVPDNPKTWTAPFCDQ